MPDERYFEPEIETMSRSDLAALQEERLLELLPDVYERSGLMQKTWDEAGVKPADIRSLDDFRERAPFVTQGRHPPVPRRRRRPVRRPAGPDRSGRSPRSSRPPGRPATPRCTRTRGTAGTRSGRRSPATSGTSACGRATTCSAASFKMRGQLYHADQMCGAIPLMVEHRHRRLARRASTRSASTARCTRRSPAWRCPNSTTSRRDRSTWWTSSPRSRAPASPASRSSARMRPPPRRLGRRDLRLDQHRRRHRAPSSAASTTAATPGRTPCCSSPSTPDGRDAVADGEIGELVATSLDNPATPMIRFRSDDLIRMTREPCALRPHPRPVLAGRPQGRRDDRARPLAGAAWTSGAHWRRSPETEAAVFQMVRPAREIDVLQGAGRLRGVDARFRARRRARSGGRRYRGADGVTAEVELIPEPELLSRARGGKLARVVKA